MIIRLLALKCIENWFLIDLQDNIGTGPLPPFYPNYDGNNKYLNRNP
jgi:hypothetical protein